MLLFACTKLSLHSSHFWLIKFFTTYLRLVLWAPLAHMLRPYSSFLRASNSLPAQQCILGFTCIFSSLDSNVWRWSLCTWNILKKRKWKSLLYLPFLSSILVWFWSLRIEFFLLYHAKEKTHFYMKSSTVKDLNHQPLWPLQWLWSLFGMVIHFHLPSHLPPANLLV